ncbi:hypothetical protein KP509_10G067000 [Ceratopteris richardii]|uniref:16S rRNA (cytosine(967)-C(5))-methyltransferase n=2 Tax=Ceratopteris richardii TaxID=49495 RepID=A0A8T2TW44_CERRI|nr:hypothetical protein KP509_10G067000 [Ceratopteris richardii]
MQSLKLGGTAAAVSDVQRARLTSRKTTRSGEHSLVDISRKAQSGLCFSASTRPVSQTAAPSSPGRQQQHFPVRREVSNYRAFSVVRLLRIEQGGAYADVLSQDGEHAWDRELDYVARTLGFRTAALDPQGQRQVTEIVAGITRWKRYVDFLIKSYYDPHAYDRMEPLLRQILRLGVYELVKMGTPPHAAVNETVKLAKVALRQGAGALVNGVLRTISRDQARGELLEPKVEGDSRSQARALADLYSHPVWMVRRWLCRFGRSETIALMDWNNKPPTYSLRANSARRVSRKSLLETLNELNVISEPSSVLEDFVRVSGGLQAVIRGGLMQRGLCSVQDESGGLVVKVIDPQPGDIIIDCCAAPGGKALNMAACLQKEGKVFAVDINKGKLSLLQNAAIHLGVDDVVITECSDLCSYADRHDLLADKVLVDAPCSGLGVLSKRADLRWRKTSTELEDMVNLQSILLRSAARLVKPGGVLVYSTCSIEPEENHGQVYNFLGCHREFKLESVEGYVPKTFVTREGYFASLPHLHNMDGAFAARFVRMRV